MFITLKAPAVVYNKKFTSDSIDKFISENLVIQHNNWGFRAFDLISKYDYSAVVYINKVATTKSVLKDRTAKLVL